MKKEIDIKIILFTIKVVKFCLIWSFIKAIKNTNSLTFFLVWPKKVLSKQKAIQ